MKKYAVALFENSQGPGSSLESILERLDYSVTPLPDLDSIGEPGRQAANQILVVNFGDSEEECLQTAEQLIRRTQLHSIALLAVGYQIDEIGSVLAKYFEIVSTVPNPFAESTIFRALSEIELELESKRRVPGQISQDNVQDAARVSLTLELAYELEELPQILFQQIKKFDLRNTHFEGQNYTSDIGYEFLEARGYAPNQEKLKPLVESILSDSADWTRSHLCRTAFVCGKLLEALDVDEQVCSHVHAAVFLQALDLHMEELSVLKENFYDQEAEDLRWTICSKVKDSAYKVAVEYGEPEIGKILSEFAKLIGREQAEQEGGPNLAASTLLAAELVDRICFKSGRWDARAAYHLMRKFKQGYMHDIHPAVWGCIIKFLSEAIATKTSFQVLPVELRKDPKLLEEALKKREYPIQADEEQVPIASLSPGMTLSKPLVTFDGKTVLAGNVILDQDLVWRIWQLSAVRPLFAPIIKREPVSDESS